MKQINRFFLLFIAILGLNSFAQAGVVNIKIATEGAFYPWNFCFDRDGDINNSCIQADLVNGHTLAGFDYDLGNTLCAKINEMDPDNTYNCTWQINPWSMLSTGMGLGTSYDIVIAQMTDTEERRMFANFAGPYMFAPSIKFISLAGAGYSLSGATKVAPRPGRDDCPTDETLIVGVQENTIHQTHMETYCNNPVITYATIEDAQEALVNGEVCFIISLVSASKNILTGSPAIAEELGDSLFDSAPSIALSKTAFGGALESILQDGLLTLFSNGVIRDLQDKWTEE
ncbi:MAG: transporter substrate-binding domain-containing protein [Pseudomonadota bacterium]